jgi:hypothetical protein
MAVVVRLPNRLTYKEYAERSIALCENFRHMGISSEDHEIMQAIMAASYLGRDIDWAEMEDRARRRQEAIAGYLAIWLGIARSERSTIDADDVGFRGEDRPVPPEQPDEAARGNGIAGDLR